jgi:hypothetical protein
VTGGSVTIERNTVFTGVITAEPISRTGDTLLMTGAGLIRSEAGVPKATCIEVPIHDAAASRRSAAWRRW